MTKKTTKTTTTATSSNYHWVKVTAFWGLIIAGIVGIINFVISLLVKLELISGVGSTLGRVINVMSLISELAFFISVFLAGYAHSRSKSKGWRIAFWVFAVMALLGILGVNILGVAVGL